MPPTVLAPTFLKSVQQLVQTRENIRGAHAQLVEMFVRFCVDYDTAYQVARGLGNAAVSHLNAELGEDASTVSRWRQVAKVAARKGFPKSITRGLPASQEIIVELARRELDRRGTIQRLVTSKKVTPDTTVREVRALFKPKGVPSPVRRSDAPVTGATVAATVGTSRITLICPNAAELVSAVATILKQDASRTITAQVVGDAPLYEQGKAELGAWWKTNGARFTFDA